MCQAVNSEYLSANIPGELNVYKYCYANLTILNPVLQYITQVSPHLNIQLKWYFTADVQFRDKTIQ